MRKVFRQFALLAMGVSLVSFSPSAQASSFVVRIDDLTDNISLITYENGTPLPHGDLIGEVYDDSYHILNDSPVPDGVDINVAYNIRDPDGTLSDTLAIFLLDNGRRDYLVLRFFSNTEGGLPLAALLIAQDITETGDWQSVLSFDAANGDQYEFQFRSDVESSSVPLPGTIWLFRTMLAGAAGVGKWRNKCKAAAALVPA
jgi:hypothetical protein